MQWTALRNASLAVVLGLAPVLTACGDGDSCKEGSLRVCACDDGGEGLQACQADQSWSDCDCSCKPQCASKDCGDDGCAGSCGECDAPPSNRCLDSTQLLSHPTEGVCDAGRCAYSSEILQCEFGCEAGACMPDPCADIVCNQAPSPCQAATGTCVPKPQAHCVYDNLPDGTTCSDGLWCNGEEFCQVGQCQPGEPPLDCSDLDESCRRGVCDELSQLCVLADKPDGTDCADPLFCNGQETCVAGVCTAEPVDCSGLDSLCGYGECVEAWKTCVVRAQNEGADCSDEVFCNGHETCQSGFCMAEAVSCPSPENPCRQSICDEESQTCIEEDRIDGSACDNRVLCTEADHCEQGVCITGPPSPDGTPCRDDNPCTIDDTCEAGQCIPGQTICDGMVVLLMYMDADNDLESFLISDWREMEAAQVEDVPWLRVFVLMDKRGGGNSALYEVLNGRSAQIAGPELGLPASGFGEVNMGAGATVTAFIHDVRNHVGGDAGYYLMFSDHGDGWSRKSSKEAQEPETFRAVCVDETSNGDELRVSELQAAVAGEGLLLIAFDACLMAMAEVAYALRNDALIMVASQETEPGDGWAFTELLSQFGASETPSPEEFGRIAVDTYIDSYGSNYDDLTLSSIDLTGMDALATAVSAAAVELESLPAAAFNSLCSSMDWYACFWGSCYPYTDLHNVLTRAMALDTRDNDIIYQTAINRLEEVVLYERHNRGHANAHGLNVYLPCNESYNSAYSATAWAADTHWDEMLQNH